MNQEYVLIASDENAVEMIDDLPHLIPEAKILERRGNTFRFESPIHEEAVLYSYFENTHCVLTRKRVYNLIA
jgi:hypothetical protein